MMNKTRNDVDILTSNKVGDFGRHLLDPRDNHLFGLSKNYFHGWELKMMIEGKPRLVRLNHIKQQRNLNFDAIDFFQKLDLLLNTNGLYAGNGGEQGVRAVDKRLFYVDYCNHHLRFILEWDDESHFRGRKRREYDIERQRLIQDILPSYLFLRLRETTVILEGSDKFLLRIERLLKDRKKTR